MKALIALAIAMCCVPAWAVNKCTGADGKVVFQDAPCSGKGEEITVRPASGRAAGPASAASGSASGSEAERLEGLFADSQKSRRKRELRERLIPIAQSDLQAHRSVCEQKQKTLAASQYAYRQNLYGKTHAAQVASEMAAAAAICDTKERELKDQLDLLTKECAKLACS